MRWKVKTKRQNCESSLWESLWQKDKIMSHETVSHDKKLQFSYYESKSKQRDTNYDYNHNYNIKVETDIRQLWDRKSLWQKYNYESLWNIKSLWQKYTIMTVIIMNYDIIERKKNHCQNRESNKPNMFWIQIWHTIYCVVCLIIHGDYYSKIPPELTRACAMLLQHYSQFDP